MATINADRFRAVADAVAADFINQGIPLNDSIKKVAAAMDMNHEQIRRLCETTNNATFNQLFNNKDKTASDRMVEFPVADADTVIGALIKDAAPTQEKTASFYEYRSLEVLEDAVKVAEHADVEEPAKPFTEKDRQTARQVFSHLCSEKHAWDLEYVDTVQDLHRVFKRVYNDLPFEDFQKQALALHGAGAVPEVNALRALRGQEPIEYKVPVKTAACIDDTNPVFETLDKLIALRTKIARAQVAVRKLERVL